MAAGRGRDMVKPAWKKEEEQKHARRPSRSRSPPSKHSFRPPDDRRTSHREDRSSGRMAERERGRDLERGQDTERESKRDRNGERDRHRDHGELDQRHHGGRDSRHRERSPDRNGGARRKSGFDEENASDREGRQKENRSREEKRPRREGPPEDSPGTHAEAPPQDASVAAMEAAQKALEEQEAQKAQPDFGYSGKLAEETNKVNGIALLFTEPPEARKPTRRWRLYVFKGDEPLKDPLYIHRQSCYLFGRERKLADIPTDHPSCSKQHAIIQFRQIEKEGADFMMKSVVVPYLMDLGSTNGTYLNGKRIEAQRYHELLEKDTIKFGNSTREYVLLHENSAGQ